MAWEGPGGSGGTIGGGPATAAGRRRRQEAKDVTELTGTAEALSADLQRRQRALFTSTAMGVQQNPMAVLRAGQLVETDVDYEGARQKALADALLRMRQLRLQQAQGQLPIDVARAQMEQEMWGAIASGSGALLNQYLTAQQKNEQEAAARRPQRGGGRYGAY